MVKRPHYTPEEILARAQQPDPLVMYYAVRKDRTLDLGQAMIMAGAATVLCADRYRETTEWADAFNMWFRESYRKVALRANTEEFAELQKMPNVCLSNHEGETLLCFPPRRRSQSQEQLRTLKPFTDAKRANREPKNVAGAISYVIRPAVMKTMGKAMAQAGHAALMCADYFAAEYTEEFKEWRKNGCPGVVLADNGHWEELKDNVDCTYVTDAGLTQVDPGTETVLVIPPTALPNEIAATMKIMP